MSHDRLFPPPRSEACLVRRRPSSQKGGTIIAEDVTDRATHDRRICDPDGYRPAFCPNCGERTLHVHDDRDRIGRVIVCGEDQHPGGSVAFQQGLQRAALGVRECQKPSHLAPGRQGATALGGEG